MTKVEKTMELHDSVVSELLEIRKHTKNLYALARKFSARNKSRDKMVKCIDRLDSARCELSSALSMAEKGELHT